jgi:hypothetical protein
MTTHQSISVLNYNIRREWQKRIFTFELHTKVLSCLVSITCNTKAEDRHHILHNFFRWEEMAQSSTSYKEDLFVTDVRCAHVNVANVC